MPLLKLKNRAETPPGYFRFPRHTDRPIVDPQKDLIFGGDIEDLVKKVYEFRVANGMPIGDIDVEIEDWLCRASGAECVPARPARKEGEGKHITGGMVARFLGAMAAWMVNGGYVEQEEAERRAIICAGCKFNLPAPEGGCSGCFGLASRVMRVIGDRKTRMDSSLQFCGTCGCSLHVVPFVPMEILDKAHKNSDFPEDTGQLNDDGNPLKCWRKIASEQEADTLQ